MPRGWDSNQGGKDPGFFRHDRKTNALTHYDMMPHFDTQRYIAVENIVRKGEIACNKQFLHFSQCFLPCMAIIFPFKCPLKCCLQFVSIWTRLKFCHLVMG